MRKLSVWALLALCIFAAAEELTLTSNGLEISHGGLEFTLPLPVFSKDKGKKPSVSETGDNELALDYGNDVILKCAFDGSAIEFTPVTDGAKGNYVIDCTLPLDWGGKTTWTTLKTRQVNQGKPTGTFPEEPFKKVNGQWALFDCIGFDMAFRQGDDIVKFDFFTHWTVTDDRQWNWQRYSMLLQLNLTSGTPQTIKINLTDASEQEEAETMEQTVLKLTENGVAIDFGPYSTTYPFPIFNYGAGWQKQIHPAVISVSENGRKSVADYGNDKCVTCELKGSELHYNVSESILKDKQFGAPWLELRFNEIFTQNGGQWSFITPRNGYLGDADSIFPVEKAPEWYSFNGGADGCIVATAAGQGDTLRFQCPGRYYMKDERLWGKFWFTLACSPVMKNGEFTIKIEFAKGKPAKVIDRFGQFINIDFPEKVHSIEELKEDVAKDEAYYASLPKPERTFWGGMPGSREKYNLTATGFFHLEKVPALNNRVVLVEPEGNLYFHIGMSGLHRGNETTCVDGREDIYEELPPYEGSPESDAWYFRPPRGKAVSFYIWNYIRKYGSYEPVSWQKRMIERCRHWGFNAFGEFTNIYGDNDQEGFAITRCIEHYASRKPFNLICPDFIDPYDPENIPLLEEDFAEQAKPWAGKPILIGYYTENERFYNAVMPAILRKTENSPAKLEFIAMMKERYQDDFNAFNEAWKTPAVSFEELETTVIYAEEIAARPQAAADLSAFEFKFFDDYFNLLNSTLKKVDPDHLYLGERMLIAQTFNEAVVTAMGKHCDVFSVNHYTNEFDPADIERFARISGLPVMLSEWSFGSHEQGLYGARNKENDEERGCAYSRYVENAAASPYVIGHQWFILLDESNTGRGFTNTNGERFNMGFLNVCDRPFKKFIAHAAASNAKTYDLMTGAAEPVPPAVDGTQKHETRIMPVGRVTPGYPVDALRTKYPGRPGEGITRSVAGGSPKKEDRADMICGWDDQFLYVLVTIQDDTPASNTHHQALWMGDSVEFFYGPYAENIEKMRPYDRQVGIRGNTSPEPDFRWDCAGTQLKDVPRPTTFVRVAPDKKSWAMEIALPWKEIGVTPKTGMKFGFDVGINLNGEKINEQANKLMWNGEETNYYRRDLWGVIVLED